MHEPADNQVDQHPPQPEHAPLADTARLMRFAVGDTEIDAELLRSRLESHGVRAFTLGSMLVRNEVHIAQHDYPKALEAIEAEEIARKQCGSCGYNLEGLPRGTHCPECNAETLRPDSGTPRFHLESPPTRSNLVWAAGVTLGMLAFMLLTGAIVWGLVVLAIRP
ncbi:MAG: hypothetical protein AAF356_12870 [Planctomycetota bacterium]